jgi:hypothetical protein
MYGANVAGGGPGWIRPHIVPASSVVDFSAGAQNARSSAKIAKMTVDVARDIEVSSIFIWKRS